MKKTMRRSFAMLMALVMAASLFFGINVPVEAANVEYVTENGYIYNWGERGEEATYLSQNAEAFYEENNTSYEALASLSGGNSVGDVPSSALYEELNELMTENHDKITSYDETRSLYQYTDCQNSGIESKAISSFYSGKEIGPDWDGGKTWNREHTWPNSKAPDGPSENDIMMLRPTAVSENSTRGNTAYGESEGYYNPNTVANGKYDLRGDVARIMLYQYVRWGNTSMMWGESGVIESEEVLLSWMQADPVDTWELGRNDAVESITGTRNVFVDYPELAFVLFGKTVPANYTTPSGNAPKEEIEGVPSIICFAQLGSVVSVQAAYSGTTIRLPEHVGAVKDGYVFLGWAVAETGETTDVPTFYEVGSKYTVTNSTTLYALYSRSSQDGTSVGNVFSAHSGALTEGEYLIVYEGAALKAEIASNRFAYTEITELNSSVSSPDASIVWTIAKDGDNWTIYNEATGSYAAGTGAKNKGKLSSTVDDFARWTVEGSGTYEFKNVGNLAKDVNHTLRRNGTYGFACYSTATGGALSLYKRAAETIYYFTTDGSSVVEDTVAPVVAGVQNEKTYYTSQNITVSDENLVAVIRNTESVDNTFTLEGNKEASYYITAVDAAGNTTSLQVTMKPIADVAGRIKNITVENVTAEDKDVIEAVLADVEALLADGDATDAQKAELEAIKTNAETLLQKIEDDEKESEIIPPTGDEDDEDELTPPTGDEDDVIPPTDDSGTSDGESDVTPSNKEDGPITGDKNINLLWYTMLMLGGAGLVVLRLSERKTVVK